MQTARNANVFIREVLEVLLYKLLSSSSLWNLIALLSIFKVL